MRSLPLHRAVVLTALVAAVVGGGCKSGREPAVRAAGVGGDAASDGQRDATAGGVSCGRVGKPVALALAEASGASYVPATADRVAHLLVVGDSGNRGAYLELDVRSGAVIASGRLPLDKRASDDLEGLSVVDGTVYAITSSGWMRHWRRKADGSYDLVEPAYPIASPPLPGPGGKLAKLRGPSLVCRDPKKVNCASNYEGLCLRSDEVGRGECAGFAAAKETGLLLCLVRDDGGRLAVDARRAIRVARPQVLTGCHFAPEGDLLWAGNNAFGASAVIRIRDWQEPARARIAHTDGIGSGFPEAIAVAPAGLVYRFSDVGKAPSLVDAYFCE